MYNGRPACHAMDALPAYPMNQTTHTHTYTGNYFIVNGQYEPHVTLRPKEVVRLRLINGGAWVRTCVSLFSLLDGWICPFIFISTPSPTILQHHKTTTGHNDYLALRLPGCRLWEIAADGVYYAAPREKGTVVLVVGSRKDVLVRFLWGGWNWGS